MPECFTIPDTPGVLKNAAAHALADDREILRIQGILDAGNVDKVPVPPDITLETEQMLRASGAPAFDITPGEMGKNVPLWRNIWAMRAVLGRLGRGGSALSERIVQATELEHRLYGKWSTRARVALKALTPEEVAGAKLDAAGNELPNAGSFWDHLERGAPARPEVQQAVSTWLDLKREVWSAAQQAGVKVAEEIDRYYPHIWDATDVSRMEQSRLFKSLIDNGWKRDDAVDFVRALANAHRGRVAAVLEIPRSADEVGYVKDAGRVLDTYLRRVSRRISETVAYGSRDEIAKSLLGAIEQTHGLSGRDFAEDVLNHALGRVRADIGGFESELLRFQRVKLVLAAITNLQQNANTWLKTDTSTFVRAAFDFVRHPAESLKAAREAGSILHDIVDDVASGGIPLYDAELRLASSEGIGPKLLRGKHLAEDWLSGAFRAVEHINRAIAQRAGELHFERQMGLLRAGDVGAAARLGELGFKDANALLRANAQTLAEAGRLAGKRLTDITQFQAGVTDLPRIAAGGGASGTLARIMFQYKTFALSQVRFMGEELALGVGELRAGKPLRLARTLGALALVYTPAGIVAAKLRSLFTGPSQRTKAIDDALAHPSVQRYLRAALAGFTTSGSLGLLSDVVGSLATGSRGILNSLAIPPVAGTVFDVLYGTVALGKGIAGGNRRDIERAERIGLRQLGGIGVGLETALLPERRGG